MIITKIQRLRGKRPRYGVLLDGMLALQISDWTIGIFGLRTGDDLDEQTIEKIKSTESEAHAKNIAINYLSYHPRSSKEVIDHLIKKGTDRACAEKVTHQLQSKALMNDVEFAFAFVRDRLKRKPIGEALIRQQLHAKGISSDDIDRVLGELVSPQNQQAAALRAAKRKLEVSRQGNKSDEQKQRKRLLDFLLRRGFTYEIALKTLRSTMDD